MNASRQIDDGRAPAVAVRALDAGYGESVVLRDVNFEVASGEVFAILGRSGSGKSTLLRHMIGLDPPLAGEVLVGGRSFQQAGESAHRDILKSIGVAFQNGALFGSLSLAENISLPLEEFTSLPPAARRHIAWLKLELVGLGDYADWLPDAISGGMRKRAALARALALEPSVLFLDEPSAGLDPVTSAQLDRLILELRDAMGVTFVIVSHELPSIFTVADRALMVDKQSAGVIALGPPRELRERSRDPRVRRFLTASPDEHSNHE